MTIGSAFGEFNVSFWLSHVDCEFGENCGFRNGPLAFSRSIWAVFDSIACYNDHQPSESITGHEYSREHFRSLIIPSRDISLLEKCGKKKICCGTTDRVCGSRLGRAGLAKLGESKGHYGGACIK